MVRTTFNCSKTVSPEIMFGQHNVTIHIEIIATKPLHIPECKMFWSFSSHSGAHLWVLETPLAFWDPDMQRGAPEGKEEGFLNFQACLLLNLSQGWDILFSHIAYEF